ncbi:MAG: cysteine hydrolase [Deltaproteobacteria bacterium]|nr:cysteine hydrolase [Deltaproteobacteria bacterium]
MSEETRLVLDPDRAALCIVEMQNDMVHEANIEKRGIRGVLAAQVQKRGVIAKLQTLLAAARQRQVPILYINFALKPGFPRPNTLLHRRSQREPTLVEGTWGAQIHDALAAQPQDFVLERTVGIDGSYGTQLYPVLRQLKRSTMIMTGVSTNLAVEGIVRASVNRGFDLVVVEDCCASFPDEWHRFSIDNILPLIATVTSCDNIIEQLGMS